MQINERLSRLGAYFLKSMVTKIALTGFITDMEYLVVMLMNIIKFGEYLAI